MVTNPIVPTHALQFDAVDAEAARAIRAHAELYHYTGEAGLKGIVESNSFRATYFADMNDAHEIKELRTLFVSEMISRLTPMVLQMRRVNPDNHVVWKQGAPQHLANQWCNVLYNVVFPADEATRDALCCTTSFCSHAGDHAYEREHGLLSQWRGYGGEGGFCLVFDSAALWKLFERERSKFFYVYTDLREVHYPRDGTKALESFIKLLDEFEVVIKSALDGNGQFTADAISLPFLASATAFKHRGFYEEREVRLIAMAGTEIAAEKMKGVKGSNPSH